MVHRKKKSSRKKRKNQGFRKDRRKAIKIKASTPYGFTDEQLTPYGGLLGLVKLWDGLKFEEKFDKLFCAPRRQPVLGHGLMIKGLLLMLFIGFCRIGHFVYIDEDPMVLGILKLDKLPVVSTFWRYLKSLAINQANSLLGLNGELLAAAWEGLNRKPKSIHIDIDTTVETVYGDIEGARVGHNPKNRGKKGLRPVLAFIAETKEYIGGKMRRGTTISGKESKNFIQQIRRSVPRCVEQATVRGDGEFFSLKSVRECEKQGFNYIIAIRRCKPQFDEAGWYADPKNPDYEYNDCWYQPTGWDKARRFVAMRIRKQDNGQEHLWGGEHTYRIFVTDLKGQPHQVIKEYDQRATAENLVGEAKREGISAIPSKNFHSNMAFFQLVMLAYNLWRWLKAFETGGKESTEESICTVRVSRLKILFTAAKVITHAGKTKINYSRQYEAHERISKLMDNLDHFRKKTFSEVPFFS